MNDGFINILKPPGMTSHDVVSAIRRIYGMKKVGHAGTLDPAAAGVLPVAIGKATRLIEYITDTDKSYRAELTLGYETNSGDDTGTVLRTVEFVMPDRERAEQALANFLGETLQTPPMHSAIKIDGNKLCDLARQGVLLDIPPRRIHIAEISLVSLGQSGILFDIVCSKGTYIRSLCADIGRALGIPAVMSFLVRTRVGDFDLESACTLEEIKRDPKDALRSIDAALRHMPEKRLSGSLALAFQQGQRIIETPPDDTLSIFRVYDDARNFIGIGKYERGDRVITAVKVISR